MTTAQGSDTELEISNMVAKTMRETHDHIFDGTFINGLTPHQYMTKKFSDWHTTHTNQLIDELLSELPKRERDYSKDNADEQSLKILVACSTAHNELLDQVTAILEKRKSND